ncbi:MAG TPA: hypothetical protein VK588_07600, partial [Chitinophagaceae bacterium]|nr:hypothetical protein [Chitinophagaceae bacterium]
MQSYFRVGFFIKLISGFSLISLCFTACTVKSKDSFHPKFKLVASPKSSLSNFVDCNMAEAWVADTFRIFPGKYGEDTVWGK